MRILPNILVVAWSLLILGSLLLTYTLPAGTDPAGRAWQRITLFLAWQGAALVVALFAAFWAWRGGQKRGTQGWWMGWGPLIAQGVIAGVVLLAVITSRLI